VDLTPDQIASEWMACVQSPTHFIDTYCHILVPGANDEVGSWRQVTLWPHQREIIDALESHDRIVILKARQLGITWVILFYVLWLMVCRSISAALLFSRAEPEAIELLDVRLKGIWERLPEWMQDVPSTDATTDNKKHWQLSGGSSCRAFASTGGDSYTASIALIDEADLCTHLARMLGAIEPTIGDGGKIVLISRAASDTPGSTFKRIYRAARTGST